MQCVFDAKGMLVNSFHVEGDLIDLMISMMEDGQVYKETEEDVDMKTQYLDVDIDMVVNRPQISAEPDKLVFNADGVDSVIISGLPNPCTIKVGGDEYFVDDGEFEFTVDVVGNYNIECTAFPNIPTSWEIEAV